MAVLLSDTSVPGKPELYLGQQPIPSAQPENDSFNASLLAKPTSVIDTLRFSIPPNSKIRKFNEITVMILPDSLHSLVGPKIAIRQFQFFPR